MFDFLKKYEVNGSFAFDEHKKMRTECNVPKISACGVYIIKIEGRIYYIGCSGESNKPREDGLYGRIVRGKRFNKRTLGLVVKEEHLNNLEIEWYITNADKVELVEYCLLLEFVLRNKRLPEWNNELKLKQNLKIEFENFVIENNINFLKI